MRRCFRSYFEAERNKRARANIRGGERDFNGARADSRDSGAPRERESIVYDRAPAIYEGGLVSPAAGL